MKDIALIYDGTHQTPDYKEQGIPFVSVENISSIYDYNKYISNEAYNSDFLKNHPELGDVLMTRIGDIGTPAYINKNIKMGYYVSLARLKPTKYCSGKYLYYYIQTTEFQHELWKRTIHVAFPQKINKEDLGDCKLYIPNIKKQEKIIKILDMIEFRINTQRKIIESKKSLIKSISQHYFKNKIANIELKDVVLINKGKQINGSLLNDTFNYLFFNGGSEASGKYNDYNAENCISISEGGNSCGCVNFVKEKFWSGGHNYTLIPTKKINLDYLYFFLKYKEKELMSLRVGTGLPNIQKESLYKFKIYVPNYNIQNRIALILIKFSESIKNEEKILKLYKKQKDYLLNKMFI